MFKNRSQGTTGENKSKPETRSGWPWPVAEKGTKLISVGVETGWTQRSEIGAGAEAGSLLIEASSVMKFAGQVGLHSVGEQNLPPPNVSLACRLL